MSCHEHCPLGRRDPAADRNEKRERDAGSQLRNRLGAGHHDIAVVDEQGTVISAERIDNDSAGLARLLEILTEHDPPEPQLEVAIKTSRGLLVAGLRAAARTVFAINPLAVSRYRDRYLSSRGKSDAFDAMVLVAAPSADRGRTRWG